MVPPPKATKSQADSRAPGAIPRKIWSEGVREFRLLGLARPVVFIQLAHMGKPTFDYRSLSVADRLELIGEIWDSIAEEASDTPDVLPLTEDQKAELDRRMAEFDADPSIGVPIDEVFDRIEAKLRPSK